VPLGQAVSYTIIVTNHGPDVAQDVVLDDQPLAASTLRSAHPSQGTCAATVPLTCLLGTLPAWHHVVIELSLVPHHEGELVNQAVAGTSTLDPGYAGNTAHATVLVKRPSGPPTPPRPPRPPVPSFTG
jgi:hypothetical protein